MIPADYAGVLGTNRASSYDATELAAVKQQRCAAHLQRSLSQVLVTKYGRGGSFTKQFNALLTEAAKLWHRASVCSVARSASQVRTRSALAPRR